MGRLIAEEDVKELLLGLDSLPWEEEVDDIVRLMPSVDAVPVVRCKDCWKNGTEECALVCDICGTLRFWNGDNNFCSWGEREDNGKID